jgi:hypothetical protein
MSNTHILDHRSTLQILIAGSILMGLTLLGLGSLGHLAGNLTGQGGIVQYAITQETGMLAVPAATISAAHSAAPIIAGTSNVAGMTIILGMILILTGLLLHALLLLRAGLDRTVPVHTKERDRKTVERGARNQRAIEVFWVEQTIRL